MKIILKKRPKNPIIIQGFPGFGLVGTIASEFLIEHLDSELIGKIEVEESQPMIAIHGGKVVEPLGIFYNKKYNVIILHAITASMGIEWQIANVLVNLAKDLNAKEVISLEGVGGGQEGEIMQNRAFYYSNSEKNCKKFEDIGVKKLSEGIIMGVTGALMLKADDSFNISCVFSDTHSNLPDSKAAAKIIEVLDSYLGLEVDPKPLLQQAQKFEENLRGLLTSSKKAQDISDAKKMSYVG